MESCCTTVCLSVDQLSSVSEARGAPIVVLGQSLPPDGAPPQLLKNRVAVAVEVYRQTLGPLLLCGADVKFVGETEASVMKRLLLDTGAVEASSIHLEEESCDTIENAKFAVPILRRLSASDAVVLVTSEFHIPRAALLFEGVFRHFQFRSRLLCIGAASGLAVLPARTPLPWEIEPVEDISDWRMSERCEFEKLLLRDRMALWFEREGMAVPPAERFCDAETQLSAVSAG